MFQSITDINTAEFATFVYSYGTWPSKRFQHIYAVGDGAFITCLVVLLLISHDFLNPREFKSLHRCVLINTSAERLNWWVFLRLLRKISVLRIVIHTFRSGVSGATTIEDSTLSVSPLLQIV